MIVISQQQLKNYLVNIQKIFNFRTLSKLPSFSKKQMSAWSNAIIVLLMPWKFIGKFWMIIFYFCCNILSKWVCIYQSNMQETHQIFKKYIYLKENSLWKHVTLYSVCVQKYCHQLSMAWTFFFSDSIFFNFLLHCFLYFLLGSFAIIQKVNKTNEI